MTRSYLWCLALALAAIVCLANGRAQGLSLGRTVLDPSGVVIPNGKVELHNPVSRVDVQWDALRNSSRVVGGAGISFLKSDLITRVSAKKPVIGVRSKGLIL
jgi:hypothetical protein